VDERVIEDRIALRALVEAYARHADRRQPDEMAALFAGDGRLITYEGDPAVVAPAYQRHGRADLARAFQRLFGYEGTFHLLGQQSLEFDGDGDGATGETYCLAHHIEEHDGQRALMVMAIRYLDTYTRIDGQWFFAERKLVVDWRENRPLTSTP
jgi:ketosteroid isomerase-like protein